MNTYIIHGQSFKGNVTLEYDSNSFLKMLLFECEMTAAQHKQFITAVPRDEQDFLDRAEKAGVVYSVKPPDLSFDRFWNTYSYKVGNKLRAEKLWNALSDAVKLQVLYSLPKYSYYLKTHTQIEKLYPETYLYQKRYENEF